jgi:hypothetical protein
VARLITSEFIPVKIHIKEQPEAFERFGAHWTPTQLILDGDAADHHRIEGYLPVEDFLLQLELGLGHFAFERKDYRGAEQRFRSICDRHSDAEAGAEACYWAGVAAYKASGDGAPLKETAKVLHARYPQSTWAKKASVWAA